MLVRETRRPMEMLVVLAGFLALTAMVDGQEDQSDENEAVLSWEQRVGIAIDVAQGLDYLHHSCTPPIIHGNIKSANILLNEKLQAKVADFGLSRSVSKEDSTYSSTMAVDPYGYLDPECSLSSRLTKKSDVYSYGVVLLELISGRPAIIKSREGPVHLVEWVGLLLDRGEIGGIVDPRLNIGDFDVNSTRKALETAMDCVKLKSSDRPTMSDISYRLKVYELFSKNT